MKKYLLFLFLSTTLLSFAQSGTLDATFGSGGTVVTPIFSSNDYAQGVAVQGDGKIVVVGYGFNGTNDDFAILRYNSDGTLDNSFGSSGIVITQVGSSMDRAFGVVIQDDGKIVTCGKSSNGTNFDFAVVRYNSDGSLDNTFGTGGIVTTQVGSDQEEAVCMAIQTDGKIVAAGFSRSSGNDNFAVVRYNTNGTLDTSFSGDGKQTTDIAGNDYPFSMAIQGDGKIVLGGYSRVSTVDDFTVVRYNSNGTLDTSFSGDGKVTTDISGTDKMDRAYSIAIQGDGKIVAVGYTDNGTVDDVAIVRYNTDGTLDTSFDGDGILTTNVANDYDYAYNVLIQPDEKILICGSTSTGSNYDFLLGRYESDGTLDNDFGTSGIVITPIGSFSYNEAFGMTLQPDGKIIAVGYVNNGSNNDFGVARYNNTIDPPVVGLIQLSNDNISIYPNPSSGVYFIENGLTGKNFEITDIRGATIVKGKIDSNTIDITEFVQGVYLLKIDSTTTKIVKM